MLVYVRTRQSSLHVAEVPRAWGSTPHRFLALRKSWNLTYLQGAHLGCTSKTAAIHPALPGGRKEKNCMNSKLLTVVEAASLLSLKQSTIRSWVLRRKITSIRVGRAVRIEEAEIQRILRDGRRPAQGPTEE